MNRKIQKSKPFPQQRRVFLITYSQADLAIFPTKERFAQEVVTAFGEQKIVEWVCCMEDHADGGVHFHMAISFHRSERFAPVKKAFLKKFNVSLHFKLRTLGYVAAYRYVCKDKPVEEVLHSEGHSAMSNIRTPQTSKAMAKFSANSAVKRKAPAKRQLHMEDESDSALESEGEEEQLEVEEEEEEEFMPVKLKSLEVSEFIVKEGIRSRKVLLHVADQRAENGQRDLKAFVLGHSKKVLNELIDTTWEMKEAGPSLAREKKTRLELLAAALNEKCNEECQNREWLRCAISILQRNSINVYVFAAAMRNALQNGRGKGNNVLIVGPKDCGKSFLLRPLQLVYNAFVNPSNTKYAWVSLEGKEVALLNDFRWSQECIDWKDFLLLLEGDTVNLPRPKNAYATDLNIPSSNTIPFFSTSIRPFEYCGKGNSKDPGETAMMDVRWRVFTLTKEIEEPRKIADCARCFADLVSKGQEFDN